MNELEFWDQAFLAAAKAGNGTAMCKAFADNALKTRREFRSEYEQKRQEAIQLFGKMPPRPSSATADADASRAARARMAEGR